MAGFAARPLTRRLTAQPGRGEPCFRALRYLDLGGNRIGDEGAELLLSAEHLSPSCKLDLTHNDVSSGMMAKLRTRYQFGYS